MKKLKLAVIGKDVSQSSSPAMHTFIARRLGAEISYDNISVPVEEFTSRAPAFFENYDGFNVTIPFKLDIIPFLSGLEGATEEAPTAAYVSLINGEYEYLLGTQRDIIRLQTRKQSFNVFPLTCFNDLYQNFSVIAEGEKQSACRDYIDYVISESENLYKTGMFYGELHLYSDEMNALEKVSAEFIVPPIVSEEYISRLKSAASAADINMLKSLLKPLK